MKPTKKQVAEVLGAHLNATKDDEGQLPPFVPTTIKILAFVEHLYGPPDPADADLDLPNVPIGFCCDVSVFFQMGEGEDRHERMIQHYGDNKLFHTFEEAAAHVWRETAVVVKRIPDEALPKFPRVGTIFVRAGQFVSEFSATGRPADVIEADVKAWPPLTEGWRCGKGSIIYDPPEKRPAVQ